MTFYNMLFGKNSQAVIILSFLGLKANQIERFNDQVVRFRTRRL